MLASRPRRGIALIWDTDTGIVYFSNAYYYRLHEFHIRDALRLTMEDTRWYDKIKEDPALQMLALVFDTILPW